MGEEVFRHGFIEIKKLYKNSQKKIEMMVLLFANAPTLTTEMIDKGIEILKNDKEADSALVLLYTIWSPLRARKLDNANFLRPFVKFEYFGDPKTLNCDRDSEDVYYADMSVSVVRSSCLENLDEGLLPQKWMGNKIRPIKSWGGCDVDYEWQIPSVEYWLKKNKVNYED